MAQASKRVRKERRLRRERSLLRRTVSVIGLERENDELRSRYDETTRANHYLRTLLLAVLEDTGSREVSKSMIEAAANNADAYFGMDPKDGDPNTMVISVKTVQSTAITAGKVKMTRIPDEPEQAAVDAAVEQATQGVQA